MSSSTSTLKQLVESGLLKTMAYDKKGWRKGTYVNISPKVTIRMGSAYGVRFAYAPNNDRMTQSKDISIALSLAEPKAVKLWQQVEKRFERQLLARKDLKEEVVDKDKKGAAANPKWKSMIRDPKVETPIMNMRMQIENDPNRDWARPCIVCKEYVNEDGETRISEYEDPDDDSSRKLSWQDLAQGTKVIPEFQCSWVWKREEAGQKVIGLTAKCTQILILKENDTENAPGSVTMSKMDTSQVQALLCEENLSSDEDDETDTYEVMERVEKNTELKHQLIKEEEENKLSERDILHNNLDEQKRLLRIYEKESNHKKIIKINRRIKIIESELQKELF